MLACLTFSKETFERPFHSCRLDIDELYIIWNENTQSKINLSMQENQFKKLFNKLIPTLFPGLNKPWLVKNVSHACNSLFIDYYNTLSETEESIKKTIYNFTNNSKSLSTEELFLLVTSAPNDNLSLIYNQLSQLFDNTLHVQTSSATISIKSLFQINAIQLPLNFEKIKAHFNLCFHHTDETFRKTLCQSTHDLILPILEKSTTKATIIQTLTTTNETIVKTFKQFFNGLKINSSNLIE